MRKLIVTLLVSWSVTSAHAQLPYCEGFEPMEDDLGTWYMIFSTTRVSDKLSIHAEMQFRYHTIFDTKQQFLPRFGLNYHVNDKVRLTGGAAYIPSWRYQTCDCYMPEFNDPTLERRIFQQLILKDKIGRFHFTHRFRLEQRWIDNVFDDESTYLNRGRYFFKMKIPITNKELADGTLFYSFYDEIMLNLTETPFNQNRFYHALGYKLDSTVSFEAGYLYNYVGGNNYNRLQFGVWLTPDLRKDE